jgi:ribonuclease HI
LPDLPVPQPIRTFTVAQTTFHIHQPTTHSISPNLPLYTTDASGRETATSAAFFSHADYTAHGALVHGDSTFGELTAISLALQHAQLADRPAFVVLTDSQGAVDLITRLEGDNPAHALDTPAANALRLLRTTVFNYHAPTTIHLIKAESHTISLANAVADHVARATHRIPGITTHTVAP